MKRYTKVQKMIILRQLDAAPSNHHIESILNSHNLTTEEIATWREMHDKYGINGLQITKINHMIQV